MNILLQAKWQVRSRNEAGIQVLSSHAFHTKSCHAKMRCESSSATRKKKSDDDHQVPCAHSDALLVVSLQAIWLPCYLKYLQDWPHVTLLPPGEPWDAFSTFPNQAVEQINSNTFARPHRARMLGSVLGGKVVCKTRQWVAGKQVGALLLEAWSEKWRWIWAGRQCFITSSLAWGLLASFIT